MANQQKESYQHLSPTYPQIPEIREENARQYLVGDIIGGFPFASGSFTDSGGFYLGRDSNDGLTLLDPWIRNRQRPNSHMTIVGGSGSGKSTAIKHIIASEYAGGRNAEYYADLKTYLEGAANGADHLLWNGYTTINPTSGFIVLDTKSLIQMSGTVLAAQYFNVLSWCWEQITRDRKERIMLIADECWTMIDPRCPQSLEFLKNAEKRARKYEGSIVVGTQSTNDFLDPEVKFYGQSVLDLPTYKLLFSMDGQSLKEAAELFDLNDSQTELISSGQRGMALMKVGRQAAKVRFVLSDERLEMFGRGGGR